MPLQYQHLMQRLWPRIASIALATLLVLAVAGVMTAHARTIGEFIDDARIAGEITARLVADSPAGFKQTEVKSDTGIVTLSGTVDSEDRRARAAQIASNVSGVKGLVNNIRVATAASPTAPDAAAGTSPVDATGTVASVDSASRTITLSDGRVLRADDRTLVYQPTTVQALKPGDRVLVRGAAPITVRAPETHMGTVARVDTARQQLILTDGTVISVPSAAKVHRGGEPLTLGQLEPGAEIVVQLAPPPSASPRTSGSRGTSVPPAAPLPAAPLDAADISVVWTPSAGTR